MSQPAQANAKRSAGSFIGICRVCSIADAVRRDQYSAETWSIESPFPNAVPYRSDPSRKRRDSYNLDMPSWDIRPRSSNLSTRNSAGCGHHPFIEPAEMCGQTRMQRLAVQKRDQPEQNMDTVKAGSNLTCSTGEEAVSDRGGICASDASQSASQPRATEQSAASAPSVQSYLRRVLQASCRVTDGDSVDILPQCHRSHP